MPDRCLLACLFTVAFLTAGCHSLIVAAVEDGGTDGEAGQQADASSADTLPDAAGSDLDAAADTDSPGDAMDAATAGGDATTPAIVVTITSPPSGEIAVAGESVTFAATVTGGTPPYLYQWFSDHDGPFGNAPSFTHATLTANDHALTLVVTDSSGATGSAGPQPLFVVPRAFDWSHRVLPAAPPAAGDWMSPVKNQGTCGACYAFAAAGTVEGQYNIQQGDPTLDIELSEQHLLECSSPLGCGGGGGPQSLDYIRTSGVAEESCIPYEMATGACVATCQDGAAITRLWRITGTTWIVGSTRSETQKLLRYAITHHGPSLKTMYVSDWSPTTYSCGTLSGEHVVVVVGYDHDEGVWIVKNSWGPTWNGNGYFKVAYGECAIDNDGTTVDGVVAP